MLTCSNYKKCLICKDGKKNDSLYFHEDKETSEIWIWCQGKCQRGYSIYEYCNIAGVSLKDFLGLNLKFEEAVKNEVTKIDWPKSFIPLFASEAEPAVEYLKSRGLQPSDSLFYDTKREGIVFPYYYDNTFVGAQVRFIVPKLTEDGDPWKITTLPNTRLGNLFYNWNQGIIMSHVKYIVVTEGAFNALSLQQVLNKKYGGILRNPFKCIALSGSGVSDHHSDTLSDLITKGYKVIAAPDTDDAGMKMLRKLQERGACTHFAMVDEDNIDWNNKLIELGDDLANYFASRIRVCIS